MSKNFLELFLDFTKDFESPTSFWKWSAYSTIAGVLRDNIYYGAQEVGKRLYPNLFVILVAPPGGRKDAPVSMAENLIGAIKNTKVVAGRTSIEALSDILAITETSAETGLMIKGGSCTLIAPELSAFFVKSDSLVPILTNMYDYKEEYTPHLVGRATSTIKGLCLTMLAASNEPLLKEVYSMLAVNGGTLRRTLIVKPDEKRPPNPLFESTEDAAKLDPDRYSIKELLSILVHISKLKGSITITKGAAEEYRKWYIALHSANGDAPDPGGVKSSIHTAVKKLALILALAHDLKMEIEQKHVAMAIDECMGLIPNYDSFVMSSGKGTLQDAGALFLQDLWVRGNKSITKREFLGLHWGVVDDLMMERLEKTFEAAGYINVLFDGPQTIYTLTPKGKEIFNKKKETIQ